MSSTTPATLPAVQFLDSWPPPGLSPTEIGVLLEWQNRLSAARAHLVAFFASFPGDASTEEVAEFWGVNSSTIAELRDDLRIGSPAPPADLPW